MKVVGEGERKRRKVTETDKECDSSTRERRELATRHVSAYISRVSSKRYKKSRESSCNLLSICGEKTKKENYYLILFLSILYTPIY